MEDTRIAVLSIIVEDSESTAKLNEMIHDYAEYVVGRMGIPYREKNISIISLVIDAPQTKISELSGKIGWQGSSRKGSGSRNYRSSLRP